MKSDTSSATAEPGRQAARRPRPDDGQPPNDLLPLLAVGLSIASLVWLFSVTGHGGNQAEALSLATGVGEPAVVFRLPDLDGEILDSETLRGKIVVLDLWGTWCAPCLTELPGYNHLQADYADRGVAVVGITLRSGSAEKVREFTSPAGYPVEYQLVMGDDEFERAFGPIWGLPVTLLVDRDWRIRGTWMGAVAGKQAALRASIDRLLEESPTP